MTESEEIFRGDEKARAGLESILKNPIYLAAVSIVRERRTEKEMTLESAGLALDGMVSTRINSQRVGAELVHQWLRELCTPLPPKTQDAESTYGQDDAVEALRKLSQ